MRRRRETSPRSRSAPSNSANSSSATHPSSTKSSSTVTVTQWTRRARLARSPPTPAPSSPLPHPPPVPLHFLLPATSPSSSPSIACPVAAKVRRCCLSALGRCITSHKALFLDDRYLKYLGWMVNNSSAAVRSTTLQQLVAIYQDSSDDVRALSPRTRACVPSRVSCDASARALSRRRVGGLIAHPRRAQLEGLKHFTSRFETRFVELTSDVDARVSADAVRLVHTLLQHKMLADPEEAMSCVLPLMSSNRTGALSRSRTGVRPTSTHPTVSSRLHPLTPPPLTPIRTPPSLSPPPPPTHPLPFPRPLKTRCNGGR